MSEYNHNEIEKKWRDKWEEDKVFQVKDGGEKEYILCEFPYPSGNLHVGHWYAFAVTDIYARYRKVNGKNVLFPIGYDAFGLPAENAAIKHGLDPREWTMSNMDTMRTQLKSMGAIFDWDREVRTCDPSYYKWTQWIFTQMFEKGLAVRKTQLVNWDPVDMTVLANEQVMADGTAERSGAKVEKKEIESWYLRITEYAERLNDDLDNLDWPKEIKDQQKNWIGKSEGSSIKFRVKDTDLDIEVFTTRADTLYGATYAVVAPEHEILGKLEYSNVEDVEKYVKEASEKKEMDRVKGGEKTGVKLEGVSVINPVNGEEIPLFVADYVLGSYGTGAVMAVPAHDERDYDFAKKYNLPIKYVVSPHMIDTKNPPVEGKDMVGRRTVHAIIRDPKTDKYICLNWKEHPWTTFVVGGVDEGEDIVEAARREALEETGYKNLKFVKQLDSIYITSDYYAAHKDENRRALTSAVLFELENDEREEIVEEEKAKHEIVWKSIEEIKNTDMTCCEIKVWMGALEDLPACATQQGFLLNSGEFDGMSSEEAKVKITEKVGGEMKTTYRLRDWSVGRQRYWGTPVPIVYDPEGKPHAVPVEHLPWTLPTDVDHTPTGESPLAKSEELKKRTEEIFGEGWTPEVETMDTFIDSSWYFLRYLDNKNEDELIGKDVKSWMPVDFYSGGAEHTTLHLLYSRFFNKFLFDIGASPVEEPYVKRLNRSLILGTDGNKMSKSKGNVIDPDEIVERLGADTVRAYLAFIGPYNEANSYPWDPNGVVGVRRFLEKVWRIHESVVDESSLDVKKEVNRVIKRVGEEFNQLKFNAGIAQLMSLANLVDKEGIGREDMKGFVKLLSVVAPYVCEEMWSNLGGEGYVSTADWPTYNESLIVSDTVNIVIQINGKVRDEIGVSQDINEEELKSIALERDEVKKWIEGQKVKKVIYVKGKLLSIVI